MRMTDAAMQDGKMRLQKFLARAGVASRRACEAIIVSGRVQVNGAIVTELGTKVDPTADEVLVDGEEVTLPQQSVVLMLNKPAGYLTAMKDDRGRPCVAELVPVDRYPGLYPVGRLDFDTTGLLLFTTDGELGNQLLHPSFHVDKTYEALVEGAVTEGELQSLREGVMLADGITAPAQVTLRSRTQAKAAVLQALAAGNLSRKARQALKARVSLLSITIHEGRKRQVKRMCAAVGHEVVRLHRSSFGPLGLDGLAEGSFRILEDAEVSALLEAAGPKA